jgi:hypothetical protein
MPAYPRGLAADDIEMSSSIAGPLGSRIRKGCAAIGLGEEIADGNS